MNEHPQSSDERVKSKQKGSAPHYPKIMTSDELLQGATEIFITHGEETYRLRLTRNGKLILHK